MSENNLLNKFSTQDILKAFLAGTNDAFLVVDASCNVITFNTRFQHFHEQYTGNQILHEVDYTLLIENTPLQFIQYNIQKALQGNSLKFTQQFTSINKENTWFDFEFHLLKDEDESVTGVGIGVFNTTDKHKANETLKQSEELFKALVINSTDAFQLTDEELKIKYVSASVKNVLGYIDAEMVGTHFFNLIHPDDKIIISSWLHWLIYNPAIVKAVEVRIKNIKGEWIFIEINGKNMLGITNIDAIVMNYRDIQAKKIADNALALAEQRMGLLLNNTKESFIIVNSRLRIITYNRAAQEHSPFFFIQELQSGISLLDLIPLEDVEMMINTFEEIFEGKEQEKETTITDKNEVLHVYNHTYRPLFDKDEIVGVFITSTNITERKKAELQLKASEERNRTIIQEAFDAMIINDLDNCIIEASPAIERLLGYTPHELIGKMCLNFIRKDFIPKIVDLIACIIQIPEKEASIDALIRKKNGDYIWVEIKGKNMYHNKHINGMIVLLRDITSRKDAEDIVSLSEQRFKGLVQSGADIISIIDEEGVVKYSSPTVINILGNDPLTDIGKNVFDFVHKDDREWTRATFDKMLTEGTRNMNFGPYRFPNAKKEYRWLETVVNNLTDDPAIKGIVINSRDVTETKRLNEEQKSLTEELVKNNLDLQQFSFITSHNLRAPVANLMSLLSLYDKVNVEEPFNKILIEKFEESTLQLNSTLNDLLEVLVLKSNTNIQIEPLSLTAIAKQVKMNIENLLIEQEGALDLNFTEIDEIHFNRLHLESVFLNLISNAIKYRSKERKLFIKITSKQEGKYVVIEFKDNGMGIDLERYKDRIFGMYQRFHAGKEGKGLGLYMIKAQVLAMGGKIEVESELGKGSIFKIYLKK